MSESMPGFLRKTNGTIITTEVFRHEFRAWFATFDFLDEQAIEDLDINEFYNRLVK